MAFLIDLKNIIFEVSKNFTKHIYIHNLTYFSKSKKLLSIFPNFYLENDLTYVFNL